MEKNCLLSETLKRNGFCCGSSSTTSLSDGGTVSRARWARTDAYGRTAVVEVEKVNDGEERGTLQPGSRRACAGIMSAEDLQKALDFHLIEITVKTPMP